MKTIESILRTELGQLERIVEEAKKRLKTAPTGAVRVRKWKGVVEFYYRNDDTDSKRERSNNGRYLKKKEYTLAKRIIQRDYDIQIIKKAEKRMKAIAIFLKKYEETSLKKIYQNMSEQRRVVLTKSILSDEEYIKMWQAVEYEGKSFGEDEPVIITERGERVRSKSEKIIADKLYALGIPYRYEYPIVLEDNIKIYPDFTILRMSHRDEVYLEHLGKLDDNKYVDSTVYKLCTYEKNGIYIGVNLFITFETGKKVLNTKMLDELVKKLFYVE